MHYFTHLIVRVDNYFQNVLQNNNFNIHLNERTHFVEHGLDFGANWKNNRIKF